MKVVLLRRHGGGQNDLVLGHDDMGIVLLNVALGGLHDFAFGIDEVDLDHRLFFGVLLFSFSAPWLLSGLGFDPGPLFVFLLLFVEESLAFSCLSGCFFRAVSRRPLRDLRHRFLAAHFCGGTGVLPPGAHTPDRWPQSPD